MSGLSVGRVVVCYMLHMIGMRQFGKQCQKIWSKTNEAQLMRRFWQFNTVQWIRWEIHNNLAS